MRSGTGAAAGATGPGSVAAEARKFSARPIGIDLSPGMIGLAGIAHPGIDFRVADVEHLPFGDCSFDAIVCNFGLGHFPCPELALAECVRTVKPGGRIALSWWDDPARQRIQGLFREAIAEVRAAPHPDVQASYSTLRFSDTEEFGRLLRALADQCLNATFFPIGKHVLCPSNAVHGAMGGMVASSARGELHVRGTVCSKFGSSLDLLN
jgi:ubiquinone/menaquinone biosynthesis C-methylase UbiE